MADGVPYGVGHVAEALGAGLSDGSAGSPDGDLMDDQRLVESAVDGSSSDGGGGPAAVAAALRRRHAAVLGSPSSASPAHARGAAVGHARVTAPRARALVDAPTAPATRTSPQDAADAADADDDDVREAAKSSKAATTTAAAATAVLSMELRAPWDANQERLAARWGDEARVFAMLCAWENARSYRWYLASIVPVLLFSCVTGANNIGVSGILQSSLGCVGDVNYLQLVLGVLTLVSAVLCVFTQFFHFPKHMERCHRAELTWSAIYDDIHTQLSLTRSHRGSCYTFMKDIRERRLAGRRLTPHLSSGVVARFATWAAQHAPGVTLPDICSPDMAPLFDAVAVEVDDDDDHDVDADAAAVAAAGVPVAAAGTTASSTSSAAPPEDSNTGASAARAASPGILVRGGGGGGGSSGRAPAALRAVTRHASSSRNAHGTSGAAVGVDVDIHDLVVRLMQSGLLPATAPPPRWQAPASWPSALPARSPRTTTTTSTGGRADGDTSAIASSSARAALSAKADDGAPTVLAPRGRTAPTLSTPLATTPAGGLGVGVTTTTPLPNNVTMTTPRDTGMVAHVDVPLPASMTKHNGDT